MRLFPTWVVDRQNLRSMLGEFISFFSSAQALFVQTSELVGIKGSRFSTSYLQSENLMQNLSRRIITVVNYARSQPSEKRKAAQMSFISADPK